MDNNELYHYGILGMRWGHRKAASNKKSIDSSYKKAHSNTKVKYLSDKDLADANKRLNAERQYHELKNYNNIGKKAVNSFIKTAGTIAAVTAAYGTYKKVGNAIVDKFGDLVIKNIKM